MAKRFLLILLTVFSMAAYANAGNEITVIETVVADTVPAHDSSIASMPSSWVTKPKWNTTGVHFAWGAEFSSTIDMSGHEMSSIDFNAFAGISCKWISMAGAGVGANIMVSNSCHTYPIFALVRTDFSNLVKFIFVDMRGGVALNYLEDNGRQTGAYLSPSLGFNLATGSNFRSYLTVGYTYISRKDVSRHEKVLHYPSLSMATVRLGLTF